MSTKTITCIVFTAVLVIVLFMGMGYYKGHSNRCIVSQPRECVGGWVRIHDYYIKYRGHTQKTHEVCFVVEQVTESQYERLMYSGS